MCSLLHNSFLVHYFIFFIVSEIPLPLEYKSFGEKLCSIHCCMVFVQKSTKIPQRLMNEEVNEYSEQRQENNVLFYNFFLLICEECHSPQGSY